MKQITLILILLTALVTAVAAGAAPHSETVEYKHGDTVLEGYLAYDDASAQKRPGILVVHEWVGLNDYMKEYSDYLSRQGYVVFAADIYGKGVRPETPQEAAKTSSIYRENRALMRARAQAGLEVLRSQPLVEKDNIAAIGFCFGGTTVLELARSGADVAGVVSFHGGLSTPNPEDAENIKAAVLVLHGGADPHVTKQEIMDFWNEMQAAGVHWQLNIYGGAVHSFTNPNSGTDPSTGAAYHPTAAKRSRRAMLAFFDEIFTTSGR